MARAVSDLAPWRRAVAVDSVRGVRRSSHRLWQDSPKGSGTSADGATWAILGAVILAAACEAPVPSRYGLVGGATSADKTRAGGVIGATGMGVAGKPTEGDDIGSDGTPGAPVSGATETDGAVNDETKIGTPASAAVGTGGVGTGAAATSDAGSGVTGAGGAEFGAAGTGVAGSGSGGSGTGGGGPGGSDPSDLAAGKRQEVIQFLWGADGFPSTKLPASVDMNVKSPVAALSNLERVDTLHIKMDAGFESLAHHFIPLHSKKDRLVILHHGHATSFDDDPSMDDVGYGMQRTIDHLLVDGYSVVAIYMPGCLPNQPIIAHDEIVETPTRGSGIKFFVEPVAVCLNYLQTQSDVDAFPVYKDFSMIGLSGGGWTTTVYAAVDPRITASISVAGSLPLSLRYGYSWGDEEQTHAAFYEVADYVDLTVLGSYGAGRRQVQVLNRNDDCCFGDNPFEYDPLQTGLPYDDAVRGYERDVRKRLKDLKNGSFRLEIDEAAPGHMISLNTIATTILTELDGNNGAPPASTTDSFVRGSEGTLVHIGPNGIDDTGIPMVGVPTSVRRGIGSYHVLFRDPTNHLMHAFNNGLSWTSESMGAVVITDPVAVVSNLSGFDAVALTPDYLPHHWRSNEAGVVSEALRGAPKTFGQPLLCSSGNDGLDVFLQGWDHVTHHLRSDDGTDGWSAVDSSADLRPSICGSGTP